MNGYLVVGKHIVQGMSGFPIVGNTMENIGGRQVDIGKNIMNMTGDKFGRSFHVNGQKVPWSHEPW